MLPIKIPFSWWLISTSHFTRTQALHPVFSYCSEQNNQARRFISKSLVRYHLQLDPQGYSKSFAYTNHTQQYVQKPSTFCYGGCFGNWTWNSRVSSLIIKLDSETPSQRYDLFTCQRLSVLDYFYAQLNCQWHKRFSTSLRWLSCTSELFPVVNLSLQRSALANLNHVPLNFLHSIKGAFLGI